MQDPCLLPIVVYSGRGAQVLNNLVHDTMRVPADGGGIYLSGRQGSSHASGALVRGNVWDADPGPPPPGVALFDNTTLSERALGDDPTAVDIVADAGLSYARPMSFGTAVGLNRQNTRGGRFK